MKLSPEHSLAGILEPVFAIRTEDDLGIGDTDGVRHIGDIVSEVYALHGKDAPSHFENTIYPGVGHVYLPEMWEKTVKWMDRWVKN